METEHAQPQAVAYAEEARKEPFLLDYEVDAEHSLADRVKEIVERAAFGDELLARVVIQGGAGEWTGREMHDWCCDYKDHKNGYPASWIRGHRDHANCGHRTRESSNDKPADAWKADALRAELAEAREECERLRRETVMLRRKLNLDPIEDDAMDGYEGKITELQSENAELRQLVEDADPAMKAAVERGLELAAMVQDLREENEELALAHAAGQAKLDEAIADWVAAKDEANRLRARVEELEAEVKKLRPVPPHKDPRRKPHEGWRATGPGPPMTFTDTSPRDDEEKCRD